jgi:hypothetical protein
MFNSTFDKTIEIEPCSLRQVDVAGPRRASPELRTALFNLERHGPAKTPYAFINSFLSEAGVSVVSFSGLSLFVLFCRRRFEPRRSSNPAAR